MSKLNATNIKKAYNYMKKNGLKAMLTQAAERLESHDYDDYTFEPVSEEELEKQRKNAGSYSVRFSILVPAYNTPRKYFKEMIESVEAQTYPNWELIIGDAGDEAMGLKEIVDEFSDRRVRYIKLPENKGISGNTNAILKGARGEYIALLDHDDFLTPDALYENAKLISEATKKPGLIYSDEDKCNGDATRFYDVYRKPNFNLDLLLSNNYICHFLVIKSEDLKSIGFRSEFDGAQDYDVTLRCVMRYMPDFKEVYHIPKVLYHWRCHEESTASNPQSKLYAYEAGKNALTDALETLGWKAEVTHSKHLGFMDVKYIPGIFDVREDIGMIGGKIINDKGVIIGGIMDENGTPIFEGLKDGYSGYRNTATLKQDADLLDIRCMKLRPELYDVFKDVTGMEYKEDPKTGFYDIKLQKDDTDLMKICTIICHRIKKMGYKLLYDPDCSVKVKE